MRNIVVQLSPASCEAAAKELDEFYNKLKPRMQEVCRRLAEIGLAEAQAHLFFDNGNDMAWLEAVPTNKGYKIVMSGEDVYFIEFGTGGAANTHGYTPLVAVYPGSFSEQNAKKYSTYGFWYYNKVRYTSTPAYMPMYYAGKKIREELPRVVREVFGTK